VPKHVVVASLIASYILLKLVVVIDYCPPIYILKPSFVKTNLIIYVLL